MSLICRNVSFEYPGNKKILADLSVETDGHHPLWISGASGSGKSTLLKLISGLLQPNQGQIEFYGHVIDSQTSEQDRAKLRLEKLCYVHQENHLIDHWTVAQNLELLLGIRNHSKLQDILAQYRLGQIRLDQIALELSGGERQRLNLLRAVHTDRDLLLIDEPTAHLDDQSAQFWLRHILGSSKDKTVVIVSHDSRLAEWNLRRFVMTRIAEA